MFWIFDSINLLRFYQGLRNRNQKVGISNSKIPPTPFFKGGLCVSHIYFQLILWEKYTR